MAIPIAITIAGSDSGGGAGIQADLKTFGALGVYGASVITALTAQNTLGVAGVLATPPDFIRLQMDTLAKDISPKAIKIGMLADKEVVAQVAQGLREAKWKNIVLDPVMVAQSGDVLLSSDAVESIVTDLFPLADIITPNLPEAAVLLGCNEQQAAKNPARTAKNLLQLGCKAVLLKGGHASGATADDVFVTEKQSIWLTAKRINTENTHGTGCSLSSAICAYLAHNQSMEDAVRRGKEYVHQAIEQGVDLGIGKGAGPIHHFYRKDTERTTS